MRQDSLGRELFDKKMTAFDFASTLSLKCNWFTGVPDSIFKKVLPLLPDWQLAPRENTAIAMAFGAKLAGKTPVVLMQNSGLGLSLDALMGTFRLYGQGLLLIVSNRGVLTWEEIQHKDWGSMTLDVLKSVDIPYIDFDIEGVNGLNSAIERVQKEKLIIALVMQRGNLDE